MKYGLVSSDGKPRRNDSHPVADPVICPYVDEGANPAFEQRGNVVLRREHGVVRRMEGGVDFVVAATEIGRDRRVHADRRADVRAVEVLTYDSVQHICVSLSLGYGLGVYFVTG